VVQRNTLRASTGEGLEWSPAVTGDGRTLAYFASGATVPPVAFVRPLSTSDRADANRLANVHAMIAGQPAADFPSAQLVKPRDVTFKAADDVTVHGDLFGADAHDQATAGQTRRPAILFVHGGPPRQMLLGWHSMGYYANAYAMNEYFATRGFIVLSVNYRLGIGYGFDFQRPANAGDLGASEYQDVLAAGRYLQQRPDVDPARIGIWGGSYGGFLTALALGRNSDVFAAGVDLHGVHSFLAERSSSLSDAALQAAAAVGDGVTQSDIDAARRVAWESRAFQQPLAHCKVRSSPVFPAAPPRQAIDRKSVV